MKKKSLLMMLAAGVISFNVMAEEAVAEAKKLVSPVPGQEVSAEKMAPKLDWSFIPEKVAKVGDKEITRDAFLAFVMSDTAGRMPMDQPEQLKMIMPFFVEKMVQFEIANDLLKAKGELPSKDAIVEILKDDFKKMPEDYRKQAEEQVKAQGKTVDEFIAELASAPSVQLEIGMSKYYEKLMTSATVTDEEAKEFYDANPDAFTRPKTMELSHVLMKVEPTPAKGDQAAETMAEADARVNKRMIEIAEKIAGGEDFAEVAKEFSECPSGSRGGSLGLVYEDGALDGGNGSLDSDFMEGAKALKEGEVSKPVKTQFGYHLIKATNVTESEKIGFDVVKDRLISQLKSEKAGAEINSELEALRDKLNVEIFYKPEALPAQMLMQ